MYARILLWRVSVRGSASRYTFVTEYMCKMGALVDVCICCGVVER
jgi:hypothetical protein